MKYRSFFVLMLLAVLIGSISALVAPILILAWQNEEDIFSVQRLVILLSVLLLTLTIEVVVVFFREKFAKNFNKRNCKHLLSRYLGLNYDVIQEKGAMFLMERIAIAVNTSYSYFTGESLRIWSSIIVISATLILTLLHSPFIALILVALIPINIFGYRIINAKLQRNSTLLQEATASGWQSILSVLKHTDYMKQTDQQSRILEQFSVPLEKIYSTMANVNVFAQTSSHGLRTVNSVSNVMILLVVVYRFLEGGSNPLALVLYAIILPLFFNSLNEIVHANLSKREMLASKEFAQMIEDNQEQSGGIDINEISHIQFNMPKLYIGDRVLASNICYEFNSGDIIWVKGSSGKGKSTLLKLLLRFRDTDGISINKTNLSEISRQSLRKNIEYLSQDVPIINGSISENLFLGKIFSAKLQDEMGNDPILSSIFSSKTMDSQVLADGANLSGGEKQKIAIARALHSNANVLLLDEIASNIDADSATEIYDRLLLGNKNKIIFIVSHDPLPQKYYTKELLLEA